MKKIFLTICLVVVLGLIFGVMGLQILTLAAVYKCWTAIVEERVRALLKAKQGSL